MTDKPSVEKAVAPLLNKDGYLQWKRKMIAYYWLDDIDLIALKGTIQSVYEEQGSLTNASAITDHRNRSIIAKSNIVLSLGSTPAAAVTTTIDDDDKTAKDLWDELRKLYTTSNTQQIMNIAQKLEGFWLKDETQFNQHMNQLRELVDKLASFGYRLEEHLLVQYLLRSIPK